MALFGFELEEIARLIALVEARELDEFLYEEEGRSLRIRGPRPVPQAVATTTLTVPAPAPAEAQAIASPTRSQTGKRAPAAGKQTTTPVDQIVLEAPIVGVFYRAEKPGAAPLVNVGDRISVGQVLGVLEAMKVFSEFKAEQAGVITAIPATDGQLVHVGTPLVILKRS